MRKFPFYLTQSINPTVILFYRYVTYCMKYVNMLISNGVKPVMVFDGQPLPSKLGTEIGRRE